MTAKELIDEVLARAAIAEGLNADTDYGDIAPKLARMLQKAIEQRDGWADVTPSIRMRKLIEEENAELDQIANGEE